jgi:hypothetical protein
MMLTTAQSVFAGSYTLVGDILSPAWEMLTSPGAPNSSYVTFFQQVDIWPPECWPESAWRTRTEAIRTLATQHPRKLQDHSPSALRISPGTFTLDTFLSGYEGFDRFSHPVPANNPDRNEDPAPPPFRARVIPDCPASRHREFGLIKRVFLPMFGASSQRLRVDERATAPELLNTMPDNLLRTFFQTVRQSGERSSRVLRRHRTAPKPDSIIAAFLQV